ncbi:MAG TPA: amidase [Stellaceae bacterium]|jgi:aspartyl-tRNA(Asn)/glutamyl-tRNA(Gln) amidotransferase subunit A|nr:amidase [Stellaceae bacterium]
MTDSDPCFLSVAEAASLIAAKRISPVELTRAYLARIERLNGTLHAYVRVLHDEALAAARAAEAEILAGRYRGPLHGIPIGLKDIYDTAGIPTEGGSKSCLGRVPAKDATTTRLLREAGAVLLGKLTTWEFAIGGTAFDTPFPPARNPWNIDHDPAGSSSGSGAAVASGLCAMAMGSDTGGSIRWPAAWCGLAGLKPTYGRVSRAGIMPLSFSLDHAGPLTWTVEDAAIVLQAIAGHDASDPASARCPVADYRAALAGGNLRGLRLGVARAMFERDCVGSEEMLSAFDESVGVLRELGASIAEIELPPLALYNATAYLIARSEGFAIHEKALRERPQDYGALARDRLTIGAYVRASDMVQAMRRRQMLVEATTAAMGGVDAILLPTAPDPAPRLGDLAPYFGNQRPTYMRPFNLTGQPALSVCNGFDNAGLPLSLQIVGRCFDEAMVLRIGHAYERTTPWRGRRPQLA